MVAVHCAHVGPHVSSGARRYGIVKRSLLFSSRVIGGGRGLVNKLILSSNSESILSLGHITVVSPSNGILSFRREVIWCQIVILAQFSSPSLSESLKDEITSIKIAMLLLQRRYQLHLDQGKVITAQHTV